MSDLMKVLQEADIAAVLVERSRQNFESSKSALERAKIILEEAQEKLNQVFIQAEENGLSRSKVKKLTEERTAALMASGLMLDLEAPPPKAARAPKKKNNEKATDKTHGEETTMSYESDSFREALPTLELQ